MPPESCCSTPLHCASLSALLSPPPISGSQAMGKRCGKPQKGTEGSRETVLEGAVEDGELC